VAAVAELITRPAAAQPVNQSARPAVIPRLRNVGLTVFHVRADAAHGRAGKLGRRRIQPRWRRRPRNRLSNDIRDQKRVNRVREMGSARRTTLPLQRAQAQGTKSVAAVKRHRLAPRRRHQKVADRALEEVE
jgi:hypothetical protein